MQFNRFALVLQCTDIPTSKAFYTERLGLRVNADIGWFVGLEHPERPRGTFELSLCQAGHESMPASLRRPTDGVVLALEVPNADAVRESLLRAQVSMLSDTKDEPWGQRHFYAQAPDGVALDVFQQIPPDPEWMGANGLA